MAEIKSLKSKQHTSGPTAEMPVNDIVKKLSKENEDLHSKVKKVSDEVKAGKNALKKVEDNNCIMAKSIRDLQEKLNTEKNKSNRMEVENKRWERNTERLEEIIEINDEKKDTKEKSPTRKIKEEKCRFFEENGWCRFGKGCHNFHPTKYCEWFQKVGRCPLEDCKDLHSQKDCPFWSRGFCKNENCRMKHDPKLKGNSSKRGRSRSPNESPVDKRTRTSKFEDKKVDVYYNSTIEERFNKQAEQNHFLAKSLAGLSAELRNLSSQQSQNPLQPAGSQEQSWARTVNNQTPRQAPVNYGLPESQNTTPFQTPNQQQQFYNPYQ